MFKLKIGSTTVIANTVNSFLKLLDAANIPYKLIDVEISLLRTAPLNAIQRKQKDALNKEMYPGGGLGGDDLSSDKSVSKFNRVTIPAVEIDGKKYPLKRIKSTWQGPKVKQTLVWEDVNEFMKKVKAGK